MSGKNEHSKRKLLLFAKADHLGKNKSHFGWRIGGTQTGKIQGFFGPVVILLKQKVNLGDFFLDGHPIHLAILAVGSKAKDKAKV